VSDWTVLVATIVPTVATIGAAAWASGRVLVKVGIHLGKQDEKSSIRDMRIGHLELRMDRLSALNEWQSRALERLLRPGSDPPGPRPKLDSTP
jgi:hypothetical protein